MNVALGIMAMILSSTSLAVVTDQFRCEMEIQDLKTGERTKSIQEFDVSRILADFTMSQDIDITAASTSSSLELDSKVATINAQLTFKYNHAVRRDGQNRPLEARQVSCIDLSGNYCKKSPSADDEIKLCGALSVQCGWDQNQDPFGPKSSWSPVPLVNGTPLFSIESLNPRNLSFSDETGTIAVATLRCTHRGTLK